MENLGGKNLGGPPVATGNQKLLFDGITVEGEAVDVDLVVSGLVISTAAAFLAKNPTGDSKVARSADDTDKMLDFIFKTVDLRRDERVYLFQGELFSRIRTALSALCGRDIKPSGLLADGASIPVSTGAAAAFGLRVPLPLSLRDDLFEEDGDVYRVGTEALKKGGLFANIQNIAGNVVLANGTAVLSGLAFDLVPHIGPGDKYYYGPSWKMETNPTQPAEVPYSQLRRAKRLFLIHDSDGTSGPYTMKGPVEMESLDATSINDAFVANRRAKGGDRTDKRGVMLMFPRKGLKLSERDMSPRQLYLKNVAGTTMDLISITHEPMDEVVAARLRGEAKTDNQGNAAKVVTPTPPSAHGSNQVHTRNASMLGQHLVTK